MSTAVVTEIIPPGVNRWESAVVALALVTLMLLTAI
jgi:hypothetical protein